jgi:hypothetical protein
LVVEIEIGHRVVVDGQFELVADITDHAQVGVHIEIEAAVLTGAFGQCRVLDILSLVTGNDVHLALRAYLDLAVSKDPVEKIVRHRHFRTKQFPVQAA